MRWILLVSCMLLISGCTSKDKPNAEQDVEADGAPIVDDSAEQASGSEQQDASPTTWGTHEYLFSVGATAGTGMPEIPSTASHPAELVDAPADSDWVRVEFLWEGIASNGATLTLSIGTGAGATMERVAETTVAERLIVVLDFNGTDWNPEYQAAIAAEQLGSTVAEATVQVRSTWFVGGIPDDDWSAF